MGIFQTRCIASETVENICKLVQITKLVPSTILQPVCQCVRDFIETLYCHVIEVFFKPWRSPGRVSLKHSTDYVYDGHLAIIGQLLTLIIFIVEWHKFQDRN